MRYVLGIDSGGTKSHVRAAALDGTPLGSYIGAPCRHYGRPMEETRALIGANIDGCLQQFDGDRADCAYLMCGAAGFDSEEDGIILHELYRSLDGFTCPMTVVNDAELAHYTVTGGVGVLVIAGTGDPYAAAILRHAGEWNFKLAEELIRALGLEQEERIVVGIWGSAILKSDIQRETMEQLLNAAYPQAELRGPACDAAEGAVRWALERAAE